MSKFLCGECIHNSDKGGGCLIPKNLGYVDNCNRYLPKDRHFVQTNEDWFSSMHTEAKAKWLADHMKCSKCPQQKRCNGYHGGCMALMLEWLKEIHQ